MTPAPHELASVCTGLSLAFGAGLVAAAATQASIETAAVLAMALFLGSLLAAWLNL